MQRRMTLAAVAILLASPAMADETCLPDANGAQCDIFMDQYRVDDVPVGTTQVWATDEFLMEHYPGFDRGPGADVSGGDDVLYWDGDSATIIPEEAGPQVELSDW